MEGNQGRLQACPRDIYCYLLHTGVEASYEAHADTMIYLTKDQHLLRMIDWLVKDPVDEQIWQVQKNRTIRFAIPEHPVLTVSEQNRAKS
jgi:hypothetical protein